ncbi:MAG: hypothetical protein QOH11_2821 [Solirubrobacteraceae bacterium]|jgi:hypothetical protein|nr:hypothetical protein [Solirubrobacteraceae bacterium]
MPAPPTKAPGVSNKAAAMVLIVVMVVGSLLMWIGAPIFWLWLGSQLQSGSTPSLGPYLLILVGVVVSMIVLGKLLSSLDRLYGRVTQTDASVRVRMPWHRSMRGERESGRPTRVVDVVMVISVSSALLLFGAWFFLLAGSSLPK